MFTGLKIFITCLLHMLTQIHNGPMVALNCVPDAVSNMASVKKEYINFCSQHTYCQLLNDKLQHVSA
jgi:hypothetical protein